jgi:hypothetical protein
MTPLEVGSGINLLWCGIDALAPFGAHAARLPQPLHRPRSMGLRRPPERALEIAPAARMEPTEQVGASRW